MPRFEVAYGPLGLFVSSGLVAAACEPAGVPTSMSEDGLCFFRAFVPLERQRQATPAKRDFVHHALAFSIPPGWSHCDGCHAFSNQRGLQPLCFSRCSDVPVLADRAVHSHGAPDWGGCAPVGHLAGAWGVSGGGVRALGSSLLRGFAWNPNYTEARAHDPGPVRCPRVSEGKCHRW